jgi:hypothetical protein
MRTWYCRRCDVLFDAVAAKRATCAICMMNVKQRDAWENTVSPFDRMKIEMETILFYLGRCIDGDDEFDIHELWDWVNAVVGEAHA